LEVLNALQGYALECLDWNDIFILLISFSTVVIGDQLLVFPDDLVKLLY
jgi:hypothetical protein